MTKLINIYCDESCHIENAVVNPENRYMILGGVSCDQDAKQIVFERIKEIKGAHNLSQKAEMKWTKVSKPKIQAYKDLISYFFDCESLSFRAVVIDKTKLNHEAFNHTHDLFYYKMYWQMLGWFIDHRYRYNIYLDIKDTRGKLKIKELQQILCTSHGNGQCAVVTRMQEVRSHEIALLQIVDMLIGAISYANRFPNGGASPAKNELIAFIKEKTGLSLQQSTFLGARKFNVFHWEGR